MKIIVPDWLNSSFLDSELRKSWSPIFALFLLRKLQFITENFIGFDYFKIIQPSSLNRIRESDDPARAVLSHPSPAVIQVKSYFVKTVRRLGQFTFASSNEGSWKIRILSLTLGWCRVARHCLTFHLCLVTWRRLIFVGFI